MTYAASAWFTPDAGYIRSSVKRAPAAALEREAFAFSVRTKNAFSAKCRDNHHMLNIPVFTGAIQCEQYNDPVITV